MKLFGVARVRILLATPARVLVRFVHIFWVVHYLLHFPSLDDHSPAPAACYPLLIIKHNLPRPLLFLVCLCPPSDKFYVQINSGWDNEKLALALTHIHSLSPTTQGDLDSEATPSLILFNLKLEKCLKHFQPRHLMK